MSDINELFRKSQQPQEKIVKKSKNVLQQSNTVGKNTNTTKEPARSGLSILLGTFTGKALTKTFEHVTAATVMDDCGVVRRKSKAEMDEIARDDARDGFKNYALGLWDKKTPCAGAVTPLTISSGGNNGIGGNVLNGFLNVQYNIVLSMVPENTTIEIQNAIPLDSELPTRKIKDELVSKGAIVIASTGSNFDQETALVDVNISPEREARRNDVFNGIGPPGSAINLPAGITGSSGDISSALNAVRSAPYKPKFAEVDVSDKNYYAITDMVLENYQSPTSSNPLVSSMFAGKMTIVEPGGFSFNDDIKRLGKLLGYEKVNGGRILYRIDVSFSGYNPSTGEWVQVIDIDTRKEKKVPFLTYYVVITKLEAKVTNTGTVYNIDFAPSGAGALRTEDFTVDATNVFTGSANTFGGFLDNLKIGMEKKRSEETTKVINGTRGIRREFEFIAPDSLRDASFYAYEWAVQKTFIKEDSDGVIVSVGKDIDILTVLKAAMDDLPYIHELFIAKTSEEDNKQFVRPRTHFTTRFNIVYGEKSAEIGDYESMKIQIIIEPFISFKKGSYSSNSVKDYTALDAQIRRVIQMQNIGSIIRKYDYLNTSTNTEVLDFGINLSTFFFESMDSSQDFPGTKGTGTSATAAQQSANLVGEEFRSYSERIQTRIGTSLTGVASVDERFRTVGGGGVDLEEISNNGLSPYEILGGGKGITPDQYSYGSTASEAASVEARKDKYLREFQDWLANDQLQIDNLHVRGDPLWLLSPYASSDMNRLANLSQIIRPSTDKVIFINVVAPSQKNYAGPENYDNKKREVGKNPNVIGGFYGVYSVESTFSGGSFTQKIQGYKINHLNYVEEGISFENILSSSLANKTPSAEASPGVNELVHNAFDQPHNLYNNNIETSVNTAVEEVSTKIPRAATILKGGRGL